MNVVSQYGPARKGLSFAWILGHCTAANFVQDQVAITVESDPTQHVAIWLLIQDRWCIS